MKAAWAITAVTAFAVAAGAQTAATNGSASATQAAQSGASQTAASATASGAASAQAGQASASAAQATAVSAQLSRNLDTKSAKVGDEVLAKTTSSATLADGTKLPKGSKLIGHVTDVQAKSHGSKDAHLAFAFDHAILRDGRQLPVNVAMRSLSAPSALAASAAASDDMMAGGGMQPGGGAIAPAGGGVRGSGLVGGTTGAVRGAAGGAGGLATNTGSGLDATAGGAMNSTARLDRGTGALNGGAGAGLAGSGTAMPVGNLSGVTFSTVNASADASRSGVNGSAGNSTATMLNAHGRNFTLDSGSQMELAVSPQ